MSRRRHTPRLTEDRIAELELSVLALLTEAPTLPLTKVAVIVGAPTTHQVDVVLHRLRDAGRLTWQHGRPNRYTVLDPRFHRYEPPHRWAEIESTSTA